ncbi:hypothetical protein K440DRAFT_609922 [Wilcoxina mikolae CBS 423.85]|nr:hypothetical protein K440DRAFT_609922 [Wilcoxina mikolae CBS 423.85]
MFKLPNDPLLQHLSKVSFGTDFRQSLDIIQSAQTGGLIVITDAGTTPALVDSICEYGFVLTTIFSATKLAELSKMDGAVLVSNCLGYINGANVHLSPSTATPTTETGMRLRTAERVARQIPGAVVIAISKGQSTITMFCDEKKYVLLDKLRLLAESTHAIELAEFYARATVDAARNLLTAMSTTPDAISRNIELVGQLREKLQGCIWTVACHVAELGTEERVLQARLTKVVEMGNTALAPLREIALGS